MEKTNLTKLIAEHSDYSRRRAEQMIRAGRVKISGRIARLGEKCDDSRKVKIDGKNLKKEQKKVYIKLNKPQGYVCTTKYFPGEKNILDLVKRKERLFPWGRLDRDSCGLIILSNDGNLAYKLTHPKFRHDKIYVVKIKRKQTSDHFKSDQKLLTDFKRGLDIGEKTLAKVKQIKKIGRDEFRITLNEGKKRQIRRMFKFFGLEVYHLKRVSFAGLDLGDLPSGKWISLKEEEIKKINKYH